MDYDMITQQICNLKQELLFGDEYGDWKNHKQLDTGEYTEKEMQEYRDGRAEIRKKINELEKQLNE